MYICDGNFGILPRDVSIAYALKKSHQSTKFPSNIYAYFYKKTNQNVFDIADQLKGLTSLSMSKQSLNEEVLKIIGRINISDETYKKLHKRIIDVGMKAYCELIYGLPGETLESYLNGFEKTLMMNVDAVLYPLLLIKGTQINTQEYRSRFKIKSKYRIIPRYVGSYGPIHSLEYEEVVVSTSQFTFEDFQTIRLVQFFYYIFSENMFQELKKYLSTNGSNLVAFICFLIAAQDAWPASVKLIIKEFQQAAQDELLEPQDLKRSFSKQDIDEIQTKGRALNIFYFCKLIAIYGSLKDFQSLLASVLITFFEDKCIEKEEVKDILNFCFDKIPLFSNIVPEKEIKYYYDIDPWLQSDNKKLKDFILPEPKSYLLSYDIRVHSMFKRLMKKHKDIDITLYWVRMNFIANTYKAYTYERHC